MRVLGVGLTAVTLALAAASATDAPRAGLSAAAFIVATIALLWLWVGTMIIAAQRGNNVGWLFTAVGLGLIVTSFAQAYTIFGIIVQPSMPATGATAIVGELGLIPTVGPLALLFLIFPDGHAPSPRWRMAGWAIAAGLLIAGIGLGLKPETLNNFREFGLQLQNPLGIEAFGARAGTIILIGNLIFIMASLSTAFALIGRFRRARGEERQQLRWLVMVAVLALFFFALTVGTQLVSFTSEEATLLVGLSFLGFIGFALTIGFGIPLACGAAIMKYRLYGVDLVIRRAVVFGALAAFITIVYVGIVVGVGTLVGRGDEPSLLLSVAATAVVAAAFQPVRDRARRFANRLVYGKRATPYEVLAGIADHIAGTVATEEALPLTAQVLAAGTGADRTEVWLRSGSRLSRVASWPRDAAASGPDSVELSDEGLPPLGAVTLAVPVTLHDELLGALTLTKSSSEPVTPAERKLVEDLSSQAGLVLRNFGLTAELETRLDEISRQSEELRSSRQRIIAAQDSERRRLERNIHDGAQQHLVALAVKLRLAKTIAAADPAKARSVLEELQGEAAEALETLRDLTRGVYPPLLEQRGLVEALETQTRRSALDIRIHAPGLARFPIDVEAATYFCCLEAVQNATKYAETHGVKIALSGDAGQLSFEVTDEGVGFDTDATPAGSGLINMRDRAEALGGSVEIVSAPGRGTTIRGSIPSHAMETVG